MTEGTDLLKEFPAARTAEAHARDCPECGAVPGENCHAPDGTGALAGLCHAERAGTAI